MGATAAQRMSMCGPSRCRRPNRRLTPQVLLAVVQLVLLVSLVLYLTLHSLKVVAGIVPRYRFLDVTTFPTPTGRGFVRARQLHHLQLHRRRQPRRQHFSGFSRKVYRRAIKPAPASRLFVQKMHGRSRWRTLNPLSILPTFIVLLISS